MMSANELDRTRALAMAAAAAAAVESTRGVVDEEGNDWATFEVVRESAEDEFDDDYSSNEHRSNTGALGGMDSTQVQVALEEDEQQVESVVEVDEERISRRSPREKERRGGSTLQPSRTKTTRNRSKKLNMDDDDDDDRYVCPTCSRRSAGFDVEYGPVWSGDRALFPNKTAYWKWKSKWALAPKWEVGKMSQGNHSDFSHTGDVAHAFDFALVNGTPVIAARDGIVVDVAHHFRKGGLNVRYKSRANYVIIRHEDGTYARYYHLIHNGVRVARREHVNTGQLIGFCGSTGYSGGAHVHFDVVDSWGKEISVLKLEGGILESTVANFSGPLPPPGEDVPFRLVLAKPFDASDTLVNARDEIEGSAVLCIRGECDFVAKAEFAVQAGAAAVIIFNNDKSFGEVLPLVGKSEIGSSTENDSPRGSTGQSSVDKEGENDSPGTRRRAQIVLPVPVLFVSYSTGNRMLDVVTAASANGEDTVISISTSEFYKGKGNRGKGFRGPMSQPIRLGYDPKPITRNNKRRTAS